VAAGYGSMKEARDLAKKEGFEYIQKLLRVKAIQQEEYNG